MRLNVLNLQSTAVVLCTHFIVLQSACVSAYVHISMSVAQKPFVQIPQNPLSMFPAAVARIPLDPHLTAVKYTLPVLCMKYVFTQWSQ